MLIQRDVKKAVCKLYGEIEIAWHTTRITRAGRGARGTAGGAGRGRCRGRGEACRALRVNEPDIAIDYSNDGDSGSIGLHPLRDPPLLPLHEHLTTFHRLNRLERRNSLRQTGRGRLGGGRPGYQHCSPLRLAR